MDYGSRMWDMKEQDMSRLHILQKHSSFDCTKGVFPPRV